MSGSKALSRDLLVAVAAGALGVVIGSMAQARELTKLLTFTDILAKPAALADRRIAYGSEPGQFGELWKPRGPGRHPVVILVHGGCWQASLPGLELMNGPADDLRRRGFVVWNVEYRRLGSGGGYPATFHDIASAVDFLRVLARTENLDLGSVVLVGHSAGGHLALWAAARSRLPRWSKLRSAQPVHVGGVVTLAGINDLAAYRASGGEACGGASTIDHLVGAGHRGSESVYADTSPVELLPLGVPQTIVSGGRDPIVPARLGDAYAGRVARSGDRVEVLDLPSAGHFELIDPQGQEWPSIFRAIRRLSRRGWAPG